MPGRKATLWAQASAGAQMLVTGWALAGGCALIAVVLINVASVIGGAFGSPFPGDFEMTEVGVAVAAFAFLPYCQLTGANLTADIFTSNASPRTVNLLEALGSFVALGFALLLLSRMYFGMLDQKAFGYTTAILQFPHWIAFIPILISLTLLAIAAIVTLMRQLMKVGFGSAHD